MIIEETYHSDWAEKPLVRRYSDRGVKLLQVETGIMYDDPIDVSPCRYTYVETDEPIEVMEDADTA